MNHDEEHRQLLNDDSTDRAQGGSNTSSSPFGAEGPQSASRFPSFKTNASSWRSNRTITNGTAVGQQLTFRALAIGLLVGGMLSFSNTYFGLQSGWVTMGSLQSAILGFGIFKVMESKCGWRSLSIGENVIVQTTAVATATMPLAAGLVGVIPAFSLLEPQIVFSAGQLILWCLALAFIGVFCAVPLRTQTIIKEKLRFPSGTATANIIQTLHASDPIPRSGSTSIRRRGSALCSLPEGHMQPIQESRMNQDEAESLDSPPPFSRTRSKGLHLHSARSLLKADSIHRHASLDSKWTSMRLKDDDVPTSEFSKAWKVLMITFLLAGIYSLVSSLWPPLKSFPVFTWVGLPVLTAWGWELAPSMGYVGQGMIMGPRTAFSMLAGAITGFGILGPLAKHKGWAPGEISDWHTGATGWILWVSLAIMLADSITSLLLLTIVSAARMFRRWRSAEQASEDEEDVGKGRLPTYVWIVGLILAGAFCTAVLSPMLHMKFYEPIAAVVLSLFVAVLAVRALGETDLNPVSGVGKLSQVAFAVIAPKQVVANLAAGAIAESAAQNAGDLMQDFKTAHLLGVCPRDQLIAMLIGSGASVFVSVGAYLLFTTTYEIPGPLFPAPTAAIWLDMAELVNGGRLPARVAPFCIGGAVLGAALPLLAAFFEAQTKRLESNLSSAKDRLRLITAIRRCLPSGIGFAVGMYVQAKWTIPRVFGSIIEQIWLYKYPNSHSSYMVIVASGLVLGEGTFSIIAAGIQAILRAF